MNTTLQRNGPTNATILSYPGFQALPKGVKQMLVASEAHFFDQPAPDYVEQNEMRCARRPLWQPFKRGDYAKVVADDLLACDGFFLLPLQPIARRSLGGRPFRPAAPTPA